MKVILMTMLYDIKADYDQTTNLVGTEMEEEYRELLISTMKEMDAPSWQFERIGLVGE